MKRKLLSGLLGFLAAYGVFLGVTYSAMTKPPEEFGRYMKSLPSFAMYAMPFPPLWNRARAGALGVGDAAPDFELPRQDKQGSVKLSSFRGSRPVVLVFGSYT